MKRFLIFWGAIAGVCLAVLFSSNSCTDTSTPVIVLDSTIVSPPINKVWFCKSIETWPALKEGQKRAIAGKGLAWATGSSIRVVFLDGSPAQIEMVKKEAAEWENFANIKFVWTPKGQPADVRISFNSSDGAWSYVGVQTKQAPLSEPTMNLGWQSPDVIKHEFGHLLGLYHEHQNPAGGIEWDEPNVIRDLSGAPNNWSLAVIRFNVLDKHDPVSVISTPWDKTSIMHYGIPGLWVKNRIAIPGGKVISAADKLFIASIYPGKIDPVVSVTLTEERVNDLINTYNARLTEFDSVTAIMRADNERWKKILGK